MVDASDLRPNPRNPNRHPQAQVELLAAVIHSSGWRSPIVVSKLSGHVVKGHARLEAAKLLGGGKVPVDYQAYETPEQEMADLLADNRIAELSDPDEAGIAALLQELSKAGHDTTAAGFTQGEIDKLMAKLRRSNADVNAPPRIDEAKQLAKAWKVKLGQVWRLGDHRLMVGDCTDKRDVEKLFAGAKPKLMVTDPPYGVEYDPSWRNRAGVSKTARTGKVKNDDRADWRDAWKLFPGDVGYIWHGGVHAGVVQSSIEAAGFVVRCQVIWAKKRLVLSRGDYHWQHEPCFYAVREGSSEYQWQHDPCLYVVRKGKRGQWTGDRTQTTLWQIDPKEGEEDTVHGTQKPVECMERPMRNNSAKGDHVYEPFAGSGTTVIAGERCGRIVLAMDIEPWCAAVTIQRWLDATGIQPVLT